MAHEFIPLHMGVLTVSDTRDASNDQSGDLIAERLTKAGHVVVERAWIRDEIEELRGGFSRWIADEGVDVVIATGGTGLAPRDCTPEALAPLITKDIPGFGELFRYLSYKEIATSTMQSRALAAMCRDTVVFLLPGSTGACRLAMEELILPQLDHRHRPCNFAQLLPRVRSRGSGGS